MATSTILVSTGLERRMPSWLSTSTTAATPRVPMTAWSTMPW